MRFSIFTPTHNPEFLNETFASLREQSFKQWEWIIVPNGGCGTLPTSITDHPQVKIVPAPDTIAGIGALKRFACEQCSGEYLLELDHDDLLTPNALMRLSDAIEQYEQPGFLFSDFVHFYPDHRSQVFSDKFGWKSYPYEYKGRTYTAMRAFPADASSLHLIFYAPNHVRVWNRDIYWKAGGHDPDLAVVDDHELLCRTYLTGAEFIHIPEVLYMYRLQEGSNNTHLQKNAEIQSAQQQVSNRYVYRLIREWCRREQLPMLDLGGQFGCPDGYQSVDLANADIECDLRRGLPVPDSSVGCVRAYDFLEHIPHCHDSSCNHGEDGEPFCVVGMMNEIYRVLAPGGWLVSRTPSTDGRGAFQDPTHVSFWNPNSFWYYTKQDQAKYVPGVKCRFQATRIWQAHPSDWHEQHQILYVFADLVALKEQRQSGPAEI